eukprot:1817852-Prymnesium_polylepis.1
MKRSAEREPAARSLERTKAPSKWRARCCRLGFMQRIQWTSVLLRVRMSSPKSAEKRWPTDEKAPAPARAAAVQRGGI